MKRTVGMIWIILLTLWFVGTTEFMIQVRAVPVTINVDAMNVGDPLEDGSLSHPFDRIREGIDAAAPGDTVFVHTGSYYEDNLVLDKNALLLVGEDPNTTIIDGGNNEWILTLTAHYITVTGFTIRNSSAGKAGIWLQNATHCNIQQNRIHGHDTGIYATYAHENVIRENWIGENNEGVILSLLCSANQILDNYVTRNTLYGGIDISNWAHDNEIKNNHIIQNKYGILLAFQNNRIIGNQLIDNEVGIYEWEGSSLGGPAQIYHNNFVNNTQQIRLLNQSANSWDNGLEGNYWSDHRGIDTNRDGLSDNPIFFNTNNVDRFPLMGSISDFNPSQEAQLPHVTVISNSSLSAFQFHPENQTITFQLDGSEGVGFCRVQIPYMVVPPPHAVAVNDGQGAIRYYDADVYDNGGQRWIYFTYPHATQEVTITQQAVTPISTYLWALLAVIVSVSAVLLAVLLVRKRRHAHERQQEAC